MPLIVAPKHKQPDDEPAGEGHRDGTFDFFEASGEEISIRDLANMISRLISFTGGVNWDDNKPNGQMRRSFDTSIIRSMGWKPTIKLEEGIKAML